jgi:hypothetical protein
VRSELKTLFSRQTREAARMSDDPGEFPNCAQREQRAAASIDPCNNCKSRKRRDRLLSLLKISVLVAVILKKYYAISINLSRLRPLLTLLG